MIVVIDTGYLIERQLPTGKMVKGYVTDSVVSELRTAESREYLALFSFMVEVRNPSQEYVERVITDVGARVNNLSKTDIDVIALTLELRDEVSEMWVGPESLGQVEVSCLTHDNGIKNALSRYDSYEGPGFSERRYKTRCYGCFSLFDENLDFCKKCGHSTLTRVSVGDTENGEVLFFKKEYQYKLPKVLKNSNGVELRSADQREYIQHQKMLKSKRNRKLGGIE